MGIIKELDNIYDDKLIKGLSFNFFCTFRFNDADVTSIKNTHYCYFSPVFHHKYHINYCYSASYDAYIMFDSKLQLNVN